MDTRELTFDTRGQNLVDITDEVTEFCHGKGDGIVHLFAPHATAGLALMELGAGSEPDLQELLGRLLPRDDRYTHSHGATGHGADHLLPVLVSPSLVLPVLDDRPALGTWQHVVLLDLNQDIAERRVRASFLSG
ncbi:MAG: secondary thiamine-phosphate synthase enzyme YjbQ [Actinomycetota bacterium]|nr:secondary thiamine-phosphate synthase enzyme YjbQ [Actinomycetota bacterium]MDQ3574414.1 secondary thiamine-phosphate synthase enzyme YjbQ [Actinomycetota bacterium]